MQSYSYRDLIISHLCKAKSIFNYSFISLLNYIHHFQNLFPDARGTSAGKDTKLYTFFIKQIRHQGMNRSPLNNEQEKTR